MKPATYRVSINPYPAKGELEALFAGHAQTIPEHKVGPHVLDYHLVHYVLSGQGRFQCMGQTYELKSGDSFFIFPGELVYYESDSADPWRYRWVGFNGGKSDQTLAMMRITSHRPVVQAPFHPRTASLFHRIEASLRRRGAPCDLEAGGYMRLLLAEYAGQLGMKRPSAEAGKEDGASGQVEHAIRWLTLQYSQPVSIEAMAQALGYHRTHLSKMFKKQTGLSPMQFLNQIRLERAKLLLHEPLTVEQVASSVGFTDALYFSKQFKKWTGLSPTEYRAEFQGKDRFDCSNQP